MPFASKALFFAIDRLFSPVFAPPVRDGAPAGEPTVFKGQRPAFKCNMSGISPGWPVELCVLVGQVPQHCEHRHLELFEFG